MELVFLIVLVGHSIMVISAKNVQSIAQPVQVQSHVLLANRILF